MNAKQKALLGLVLSFSFIGCAAEAEPSSDGFANHKLLAEFTVARGGNLILLPVKFRGKEYSFLLDTGSSHTAFDTPFKHDLGNAKRIGRVETAGNPIMVELFDAPEALLGSLNIQDCGEVVCTDLKRLSPVVGRKISGIIGMNFLKKYVVQINFDKGTLLFLQPMRVVRHRKQKLELTMLS